MKNPDKIPQDMVSTPCLPCDLKPGDRVTYTNDQGVVFKGHEVKGFTKTDWLHGSIVYIDTDCWWMPKNPKNLTRE
jgi:hypothetical protein